MDIFHITTSFIGVSYFGETLYNFFRVQTNFILELHSQQDFLLDHSIEKRKMGNVKLIIDYCCMSVPNLVGVVKL